MKGWKMKSFRKLIAGSGFLAAFFVANVGLAQGQTGAEGKGGSLPIGGEGNRMRIEVLDNGSLKLGELTMHLDFREGNTSSRQTQKGVVQPLRDFPRTERNKSWRMEGMFQPLKQAEGLSFSETVTSEEGGEVRFAARLEGAVKEGKLRLIVQLPQAVFVGRRIFLDSNSILLPPEHGDFSLGGARVKNVRIPLEQGMLTISGDFDALLVDARAFDEARYGIILTNVSPSTGGVELDAVFALAPYAFTPVNLAEAVNRGLRDEVAADKAGGWTDEGSDHDLSDMPVGSVELGGVPFDILDESKNKGKAAMVFSGPQRPYFEKAAVINMPSTPPFKTLNLLHAFAWDRPVGTPLGSVEILHADGTSQTHDLRAHEHASNWTAAYDAPNGQLVWNGSTQRHPEIGLNLTRLPLTGKPIEEIRIQGSGEAVWMIVAMTGSDDPLPPLPTANQIPFQIEPSEDWQEMNLIKDVESGSALDFSWIQDAPAGKYGPLVTRDGQWYFRDRPDIPVRFWGTNLVWNSSVPDKALARQIADRLAKMGYNAVRIHHNDGPRGLLRSDATSSYDIDPEKLDRLDYLVSCLREAGLYTSFDLYAHRHFPAGESEEFKTPLHAGGLKTAITLSPSLRESWAKFATTFLKHRNPYTGDTYAEDPSIVSICPVNENVLELFWGSDGAVAGVLQGKFEEWIKNQHPKGLEAEKKSLEFSRFLMDLQIESHAEISRILQDRLGLVAPITDVNHRDFKQLTLARDRLDVVDVHRYWDHPRFAGDPWKLPFMYRCESAMGDHATLPRELFPTRITGLPFIVTEIAFCYPNPFRAEMGALVGAYGSLQSWSGIFRFNYSGPINPILGEHPIEGLNTVNDPVALLTDRITSLLFLRKDVSPARAMVSFEINPETLFSRAEELGSFSPEVSRIGLLSGLGSHVAGNLRKTAPASAPVSVVVTESSREAADGPPVFAVQEKLCEEIVRSGSLPGNVEELQQGIFVSDTGELVLDVNRQTFKAVTPRSETFSCAASAMLEGEVSSVETSGAATVMVASLDDKPLPESRRILVLHLTDAQNSGVTFRSSDMKVVEAWGQAPVVIRAGTMRLALTHQFASEVIVHALDMTGRRLRQVPTRIENGRLVFEAETTGKDGVVFAYEIVTKS